MSHIKEIPDFHLFLGELIAPRLSSLRLDYENKLLVRRGYPLCRVVKWIVSLGFEPRSAGPEPTMMDHYTKRLAKWGKSLSFFN